MTNRGSAGHPEELARVDAAHRRLWVEARIILSAVVMLLIVLQSGESTPSLLVAVLSSHVVFGIIHLWRVYSGGTDAYARWMHWLDIACYGTVVNATGGFESDYILSLLFPVIVASFQSGFRSGALAALVSTVLLFGARWAQLGPLPGGDWKDVLFGPAAVLLLVGLTIARWGKSENTLVRRVALSSDLNRLSSARLGLHEVIHRIGLMLCAYQRADTCIVVLGDESPGDCLVYQVKAGSSARHSRGSRPGSALGKSLIGLPPDQVVVYQRHPLRVETAVGHAYDVLSLKRRQVKADPLSELANLLETDAFVSLPLCAARQTMGRVYLTSSAGKVSREDVEFMVQAVEQAALLINHVQLLDRIIFETAKKERKRISRDLHDGTIQPYIGLKLALEALRRKLGANERVSVELDQLIRMAGDGIEQLRGYVGQLQQQQSNDGDELLLRVLKQQAEKFSEFYGIHVTVCGEEKITVPRPLSHEITQIFREGLSNIRRHTASTRAEVRVRDEDKRLVVEFIQDNDNDQGRQGFVRFHPRSLSERTRDLGGQVSVSPLSTAQTAVVVELPN